MDRWLNNVNVVRVAAVLLGILLWLVIRLNQEQIIPGQTNPVFQTDTIVDAVVTTMGLDEGQYHLMSIEPDEVDIIVEGTSTALNRIPTSQYSIIADLTGLADGTHQVKLIAQDFPTGVDVRLEPDTVKVNIEKMETKQFDVFIDMTGMPEDGLKAGVPVANPARVHATVPSGRLDDIHSIRGKIDVQGAADNVVREVRLEAYDASGRLLEGVAISPSIVSVEVPIHPPFRSVPLQISYTGNPPVGLSVATVSQDTQFVTIYGQQETIDAIDFYEGVVIDLSALTGDSTTSVAIPLMNQVTNVEPGEVQVTIDLEPTTQRTFSEVPIRLFGDSGEYELEMIEPETGVISLTVEGAPVLVNSLTAGDVQVILDVSNITPGNYVLPLRVTLPRFVHLAAADELRASIHVIDPDVEPVSEDGDIEGEEPLEGVVSDMGDGSARERIAGAGPSNDRSHSHS